MLLQSKSNALAALEQEMLVKATQMAFERRRGSLYLVIVGKVQVLLLKCRQYCLLSAAMCCALTNSCFGDYRQYFLTGVELFILHL